MKLAFLTIFFGSVLLFGVQPMLGRTLLPSFGGTAAVWTVCLAAYQILLLVGYGYAHLVAGRGRGAQRRLHVGMLVVAALWAYGFAFFRNDLKLHLGNSGLPALEVLGCVLALIGLPYVLLSANSTLLQSWLSGAGGASLTGRNVYRLYAVSNLGSLLGLLLYPFLLEPFVSLDGQWYGFATGLLVYTVLLVAVAKRTARGNAQPSEAAARCPTESVNARHPVFNLPEPLTRRWVWFMLPALSSFLLVATTNRLTLETTPMPLFWVLLLSAFLLSYVVGFSAWAERWLMPLLAVAVLSCAGAGAAQRLEAGLAFEWLLLSGVAVLFFGGCFLHGWLHAVRPEVSHLTVYYLAIAAGGAVGGVAASLLPPLLFKTAFEFPLALTLLCGVAVFFVQRSRLSPAAQRNLTALAAMAIICVALCRTTHTEGNSVLLRMRNFYGILRVERKVQRSALGTEVVLHYLKHGNTTHGIQFRDCGMSLNPTAYFGEHAGGYPIVTHPKRLAKQPLRVGVVGLGAGVLASFGQPGDTFRFYEINPQVIQIATNAALFSYISDCQARVEIVLGDARKQLEAELASGEPKFDVLIVDVFSGDSIAPHMISIEAFDTYRDRLAKDGVFGIHISNWHIDLFPLCKGIARRWNSQVAGVVARADETRAEIISFWAFFSAQPLPPFQEKCLTVDFERVKDVALPTDEKGSLLSLMRFLTPPPVKAIEPR